MKRLWMVVLLFIATGAFADPLIIQTGGLTTATSGSLSAQDFVGYSFSGDGFRGHGGYQLSFINAMTGFSAPFWRLNSPDPDGVVIEVDGFAPCHPPSGDYHTICGSMAMTYVLPPVLDKPTYLATVPFHATGHLNVGPGFDMVGDGLLTVHYVPRLTSPDVTQYFPEAQFIFQAAQPQSVSEPPGLWMFDGGLVLLLGFVHFKNIYK